MNELQTLIFFLLHETIYLVTSIVAPGYFFYILYTNSKSNNVTIITIIITNQLINHSIKSQATFKIIILFRLMKRLYFSLLTVAWLGEGGWGQVALGGGGLPLGLSQCVDHLYATNTIIIRNENEFHIYLVMTFQMMP